MVTRARIEKELLRYVGLFCIIGFICYGLGTMGGSISYDPALFLLYLEVFFVGIAIYVIAERIQS